MEPVACNAIDRRTTHTNYMFRITHNNIPNFSLVFIHQCHNPLIGQRGERRTLSFFNSSSADGKCIALKFFPSVVEGLSSGKRRTRCSVAGWVRNSDGSGYRSPKKMPQATRILHPLKKRYAIRMHD